MQKPTLIILSTLIIPVMSFTTSAQQSPLAPGAAAPSAQSTKPAPPPSDPFARPGTPSAPAAAKPKKEADPVNLLTTLETWAVNDADALALLEMPDSQGTRYAQLQTLAQAGKARLVALTALSSKSGQRSVVESADEVRYPMEFSPPSRMEDSAFPVAWGTRDAGDLLELEATRREDESDSINLNIVPRTVRLEGFDEIVTDPEGTPISKPRFSERRVTTSSLLTVNHPTILSVSKPLVSDHHPQPTPEMHVQVLCIAQQPAPAPDPSSTAPKAGARVEFLVYRLDRAVAAHLLRESAGSEPIHTALREHISSKKAVLESFTAFAAHSGNRTVYEEYMEQPFADEIRSPRYVGEGAAAIKLPSTPTGFQTKSVGTSIEIEVRIDPKTRYVEVNLVPSIVSYLGLMQVDGVAQRYPAQPLFSTRKITTSVTAGFGKPMLLGTMNQPRDNGVNGRKDDGKTSLAFIRVMPLTP